MSICSFNVLFFMHWVFGVVLQLDFVEQKSGMRQNYKSCVLTVNPREGNSKSTPMFCLENSTERAWWAKSMGFQETDVTNTFTR